MVCLAEDLVVARNSHGEASFLSGCHLLWPPQEPMGGQPDAAPADAAAEGRVDLLLASGGQPPLRQIFSPACSRGLHAVMMSA